MASFTLSTTSGPYEGSLGLTLPTHSPWSGGSRLNWLPPAASRWSVWSSPSQPRWFSLDTSDRLRGDGRGGVEDPEPVAFFFLPSLIQAPNSLALGVRVPLRARDADPLAA